MLPQIAATDPAGPAKPAELASEPADADEA